MPVTRSDQRAARLRRAWRMALLLQGSVVAARPVYQGVGRAAGLETIDPVRLDRMALLVAREQGPPIADEADAASEAYRTLAELPPQSREAWLLREVERLDEVAAARTMDCSKTAMNRHLDRAEALLGEAEADAGAMRAAINRWLNDAASQVPPDPRRVARRRRMRRALWTALAIAAAAAGAAIWLASG